MSYQIENRIYTYGEILKFPENERWELIDGMPYLQARPSIEHQGIMMEISNQIYNYLKGKPCKVFTEPAVWLDGKAEDKNSKNYIIPDIVVVCDPKKIVSAGIIGTPDMIVEIVSPSNARIDKVKKLWKYRDAGVKEYWIIEPDEKIITVYRLDTGFYKVESYDEGLIKVGIMEELSIDIKLVFPE